MARNSDGMRQRLSKEDKKQKKLGDVGHNEDAGLLDQGNGPHQANQTNEERAGTDSTVISRMMAVIKQSRSYICIIVSMAIFAVIAYYFGAVGPNDRYWDWS